MERQINEEEWETIQNNKYKYELRKDVHANIWFHECINNNRQLMIDWCRVQVTSRPVYYRVWYRALIVRRPWDVHTFIYKRRRRSTDGTVKRPWEVNIARYNSTPVIWTTTGPVLQHRYIKQRQILCTREWDR